MDPAQSHTKVHKRATAPRKDRCQSHVLPHLGMKSIHVYEDAVPEGVIMMETKGQMWYKKKVLCMEEAGWIDV